MRLFRRQFCKLIGLSLISKVFFSYNFLINVTKKIVNPNLSDQQKKIMLEEATERPYSSSLN